MWTTVNYLLPLGKDIDIERHNLKKEHAHNMTNIFYVEAVQISHQKYAGDTPRSTYLH